MGIQSGKCNTGQEVELNSRLMHCHFWELDSHKSIIRLYGLFGLSSPLSLSSWTRLFGSFAADKYVGLFLK